MIQYWMVLAIAQLVCPGCLLTVTAKLRAPSGSCQHHSLLEEKKNLVSSSIQRGAQIKFSFLPFLPLSSALQNKPGVLSGSLTALTREWTGNDELEFKERNTP